MLQIWALFSKALWQGNSSTAPIRIWRLRGSEVFDVSNRTETSCNWTWGGSLKPFCCLDGFGNRINRPFVRVWRPCRCPLRLCFWRSSLFRNDNELFKHFSFFFTLYRQQGLLLIPSFFFKTFFFFFLHFLCLFNYLVFRIGFLI